MKHNNNMVYWLYDQTCRSAARHGYVGITCDIRLRVKGHRRSGRFPDGFKTKILFWGTRQECAAMEKRYRPQPDIGWNICSGGWGGHTASPSTRARQRAAKLGKKQKPDVIAKRTAHQKGRKLSDEHRAKLSPAMKGIPKSAEHREKLRAANVGRFPSQETRAKLSAIRSGRKLTSEHRKNVSDAIRLWHKKRKQEGMTGPQASG